MRLESFLIRKIIFSDITFGPGARTKGVIDHIRKEITEIEASNGSMEEWVDVVLLALDGLCRSIEFNPNVPISNPVAVASLAATAIEEKQTTNELRKWPDWRGNENDAIEHLKD